MSDLLVVTVHGELVGRAVSSSFAFHKTTGPGNANRTKDMVNAFDGAFETLWLAMLSHDYTLQGYSCRDPEKEQCYPSFKPAQQINGAINEQSLPPSQAAVIRLNCDAETGRHNGRSYVAGVPETVLVNEHLTTGYMSAQLQPFADRLVEEVVLTDGGTYELVVLVRDRVNHPPHVPDWNPVVQATPLSKLITQRRRRTTLLGVT